MTDYSESNQAELYQRGNNQADLIGTIESELTFNHEVYGEEFYTFTISVPRLSGTIDHIRVVVSERLLMETEYETGDKVKITGQFRSYNSFENGENRLILTVFAKDMSLYTVDTGQNPNTLYLDGYVCKAPVFRTTPFDREIADMLIAVNRSYNKSDYIPTIAWGRNARFARTFKVGDNVRIWGRIQSRQYQKTMPDGETVTKTAFEVSVNRVELVKDQAPKSESDENSEM